jgi:hypothetical protein
MFASCFKLTKHLINRSNWPRSQLHTKGTSAPGAMHFQVPQSTARPPRTVRKLLQRTNDTFHDCPCRLFSLRMLSRAHVTDWAGKIAYGGTCIALVVVRVTLLEGLSVHFTLAATISKHFPRFTRRSVFAINALASNHPSRNQRIEQRPWLSKSTTSCPFGENHDEG